MFIHDAEASHELDYLDENRPLRLDYGDVEEVNPNTRRLNFERDSSSPPTTPTRGQSAFDQLSQEFETITDDYEELEAASKEERRRREQLEKKLEAEKQHNANLIASSAMKQGALEKALAKAQSMWMKLEVSLAESQAEVSSLKEALSTKRKDLVEALSALATEREERLRLQSLHHNTSRGH